MQIKGRLFPSFFKVAKILELANADKDEAKYSHRLHGEINRSKYNYVCLGL